MTFCIKCGREIKADANFCPYCGRRVVQPKKPLTTHMVRQTLARRNGKVAKLVGGAVAVAVLVIVLVIALLLFRQGIGIERELAKVPSGYYSTNVFPNYGGSFSDLERFLTSGFKLPTNYRAGVFDCSESAAYVEWALEDAGFNASIATGPAPWDPSARGHAWVIVYTTQYRVAIEPTALTGYGLWDKIKHFFTGKVKGIVYSGDEYWERYYNPQNLYPDIYVAIRTTGGAEEWNWWVGAWGFV